MLKSLRVITALILREMATTYGKSLLGYLWAFLQPVGSIALFTLVISIGLRVKHPGIGTSFILFYASGIFPYSVAMETAKKVGKSVNYSKSLLKYPVVTLIDAIIARVALIALTMTAVYSSIFIGIIFGFSLDVSVSFSAIAAAFSCAILFGLGLGTLNCYLFYRFPAWTSIWAIITRPLFLLSTIIYSFEQIPSQYQYAMTYNPLVHLVGLMRRGIYVTYEANYVSNLYVIFVGMILLVIGLTLTGRYYKRMLYA